MANIKKGARAYYADTDYKRDGMTEAYGKIDSLPTIPTPEESDAGKVIKVNDSGVYALSDDLHTPVVANPDTESTERLDKLTVGNTTYLVNEDVLPTVLKAVRLKINTIHGNDQNVAIRRLRMKNTINGDYYQFGSSDTCTCSTGDNVTPLIDNGTFDEVYVASSKLPFSIDINFEDGIDITQYNEFGMICSPYENASPLNVDILVSADGEHFIEVGSNSNVGFTYQAYVSFYKFGDVDIKIPDYTSADRGKFLGIDNTDHVVWDNVPNELPTVTSADAGKVLGVDSNGAWELDNPNVVFIDATTDSAGTPTTITLTNLTCRQLLAKDLTKEYVIRAIDSNGNINLFHQMCVTISEVQNSMNFFSLGMQYGAVNKIFSFVVLPSDSSVINVTSVTLATQ